MEYISSENLSERMDMPDFVDNPKWVESFNDTSDLCRVPKPMELLDLPETCLDHICSFLYPELSTGLRASCKMMRRIVQAPPKRTASALMEYGAIKGNTDLCMIAFQHGASDLALMFRLGGMHRHATVCEAAFMMGTFPDCRSRGFWRSLRDYTNVGMGAGFLGDAWMTSAIIGWVNDLTRVNGTWDLHKGCYEEMLIGACVTGHLSECVLARENGACNFERMLKNAVMNGRELFARLAIAWLVDRDNRAGTNPAITLPAHGWNTCAEITEESLMFVDDLIKSGICTMDTAETWNAALINPAGTILELLFKWWPNDIHKYSARILYHASSTGHIGQVRAMRRIFNQIPNTETHPARNIAMNHLVEYAIRDGYLPMCAELIDWKRHENIMWKREVSLYNLMMYAITMRQREIFLYLYKLSRAMATTRASCTVLDSAMKAALERFGMALVAALRETPTATHRTSIEEPNAKRAAKSLDVCSVDSVPNQG